MDRLRTALRVCSSLLIVLTVLGTGRASARTAYQDGVIAPPPRPAPKNASQQARTQDRADGKSRQEATAPSDKQAQSPVAAESDDDRPGQPAGGNKSRRGTATGSAPSKGATVEVEIFADSSSKNGDISIHQGYVNATWANTRLQADSVSYNEVTGDMVAEGNVIYDEGPEQRITARRAELNVASHRGTFWNTTGFTDRTATGEFLYYSADRVVKTGSTTYELYNATVTACEDIVPKWSFHSKRAELKVDDRVRLYDAVFLVRGIPVIPFPFAWLPATKTERKSGFLIPSTTNSNQKGRVLNEAYFQTLGPSADLTIRTDIYSQRGIGLGAQFRAQTSDNSYVRVGVFNVQDRLFGTAGPNQGGTSLVATGVQYLPGGWIAAGNVSLVTSLDFRQVFSDDIRQVIDPRQQSQGYVENNTGSFSFSALASDEITTLFTPGSVPSTGTTEDVKVRQLPEVELNQFSRQVFRNLPIYFSFDSTFGSLSRREVVDDVNVLATPAVQRFDLQPRVTISLPSLGGIAITPSFSFRETFYSNSIKPNATLFDPNSFAVSSTDPRLNPTDPSFVPGLRLFDPVTMNPLSSNSLSRHYGEFSLDIRPPAFEKDYLDPDGSQRFRHVIEPYVTYRVITGIGPEFNQIIRFDDRDAVANTNQIEYAVVNRFFITRPASEILRRRKRAPRVDEMTPERPEVDDSTEPANPQGGKASPKSARTESAPDGGQQEPVAGQVPAQQASGQEPSGQQSPAGSGKQTVGQETGEQESSGQQTTGQEGNSGKTNQLETGESSDLRKAGIQTQRTGARRRGGRPGSNPDEDTPGADDASDVQAYEFLTVKVAQEYFFDRTFGGALIPGQRNQFFPINTLSGFTFGGAARSFSPVNIEVNYRPLSPIFADLRLDAGTGSGIVRDVTVSAGARKDKLLVQAEWFYSRQVDLGSNGFEAGTFSGNQVLTGVRFGDSLRGFYGGTSIGYDFTNRFVTPTQISKGRLTSTRSFFGYNWDCCGLQLNYNTFKAGLRNENALSVTFYLAGIGTYGTDQFSQLNGTPSGGKRRRGGFSPDDSILP